MNESGSMAAAMPGKRPRTRRRVAPILRPALAKMGRRMLHRLRPAVTRTTQQMRRKLRRLRPAVTRTTQQMQRKLRPAQRAMRQSLQRTLRQAQRARRQGVKHAMRQMTTTQQRLRRALQRKLATDRSGFAMAAAGLALLIMSTAWLALSEKATAVPNRDHYASATEDMTGSGVAGSLANIRMPLANPMRMATPDKQPGMTARQAKERALMMKRSTKRHRHDHVSDAGEAAPGTRYASVSAVVAEARRYLGTNPTGRARLWCGAFMDMVLRRTGHPGGGNLALSYAHYGTPVSGPQVGAIAVMGRRGGGHVGVVSGIKANGNPIIVSGNHNHTVAETVYPRSRILAYVMPN